MKKNMIVILATIGACLTLFTCEKNSHNPRTIVEIEEKSTMQEKKPKVAWPEGTEVFFLLRNQRIIPAKGQPPENFYIKGLIEKGEFIPKSGVLGTQALADEGRTGWLEFGPLTMEYNHQFVPMETAREPRKPYVVGVMTKQGFIPSQKTVYTETGQLP